MFIKRQNKRFKYLVLKSVAQKLHFGSFFLDTILMSYPEKDTIEHKNFFFKEMFTISKILQIKIICVLLKDLKIFLINEFIPF